MTDALKPCPFCGGQATHAKAARGWKVECEGRMGSCTINARTHYQPHKFLAISAWNTRANTATPAPAVPTVKPLVWECTDWSAGDGVRGENDCEWATQVWPLTNYIISWFGGGRFEINTPTDETLKASSLEAAKAAAQADYEARILSAITMAPADPLAEPPVVALVVAARNEALVDAAKVARGMNNGETAKAIANAIRALPNPTAAELAQVDRIALAAITATELRGCGS